MTFTRYLRSALFGVALGSVIAAPILAEAAETIDVKVGYSEVLKSDDPAETVIVGNDAIANATIAARNTIVITGNAIGSTNLILLDEAGAEIFSSVVRVLPVDPRQRRSVRLITGGANESASVYVCGPEPGCAPAEAGIATIEAGSAAIAANRDQVAGAPEERGEGEAQREADTGPATLQ